MSAVYRAPDQAAVDAAIAAPGFVFGVAVEGATTEAVPGVLLHVFIDAPDEDQIVRYTPPGDTGWMHCSSGPDLTVAEWIAGAVRP